MLSQESHYCLSQWTEFSSGKSCRLLEWLLEFNDLRCLPLSSAEECITGVASNWLYKCLPTESIWPGYFLSETYHPIFTWCKVVATIVSRLLIQDVHTVGWGFAIFLGKSWLETEYDRCPILSPRIYRVQNPKPVLIREQCYGFQINSALSEETANLTHSCSFHQTFIQHFRAPSIFQA